MITNTSSPAMSFQLRLAVTVTAGIGTLFMLIAISTNHWVTGNGRDDVENVGLWKVCLRGVCVSHGDIIYSKILLVIAMLLGIFSSALIVLAQVYGVTDVKYQVAKLMFLTGDPGIALPGRAEPSWNGGGTGNSGAAISLLESQKFKAANIMSSSRILLHYEELDLPGMEAELGTQGK
ncbi:uncharacterized protein ACMZJ9_019456 [Mantella aurantiaca]